jgi:hypothetical protein
MRCCALRAVYFDGGFRPPTPGYFLLSRQKKLTKEKATRLPRPAGSLRVSPESALAYAPSLARRRGPAIPGGSPSGLIRFGLRCSARQTGGRRKVKIKTAPFPVGCAPRTVSFGWHGIGAQCAPYIVMCARSAHTLGAMPQASRLCLSNPFVSPSNAARGGIARRGRAMDGAHSSVGTGTCRRKTIRQDCRIAQPQAARRARYMDVPSAPAPGE